MFAPEGIFSAMLTPFNDDLSLNEPELRRMVDFMIERGLHGLFPVASVGEAVQMSVEQKIRMIEVVTEQANGRVPVCPGVASSNPEETLLLTKAAKENGASGVVCCSPIYFKPGQEGVERFFEVLADEGGLPVILYNIPMFAEPISYDVLKRLSRRENIVGIKDSSGSMVDFMHFIDKVRIVGTEMNFLTGREETLLACLTVGGKGCMTAASGIIPEIMTGIYNAFYEGNLDYARELQFAMLNVVRGAFAMPFPLGFKVAMEQRGFKMGPTKLPLSSAEQFLVKNVRTRIEMIMGGLKKQYPELMRPA